MAGFTAIPNLASRACSSREDKLAMWWCVHQADLWGWDVGFDASNTTLQQQSGGSRSWAQGFVARMTKIGVIAVLDSGSRHKSRVIALASPFEEDNHERHDKTVAKSDHPNPQQTPTMEKTHPPAVANAGSIVPLFDLTETETETETDLDRAWKVWRELNPKSRAKPNREFAKKVKALLKEFPLDDICLVFEFVHADPWYTANRAQSAALTFDGTMGRIAKAKAWEAGGRHVDRSQGYEGEATKAWGYLQTLLRARSLPDPLHEDERAAAAISAAISESGGLIRIRQARQGHELRAVEAAWCAAYCTARSAPQTATKTSTRAQT